MASTEQSSLQYMTRIAALLNAEPSYEFGAQCKATILNEIPCTPLEEIDCFLKH